MRWDKQALDSPGSPSRTPLPIPGLARSITTPEFAGITFHEVLAKSALNKVPEGSPMPFAWTINPYRGCSHQCVYCFARNTHKYLDFDAGDDFDRQIVVKVNTAEVLRKELARKSWKRELVALGSNTDPYQRAEGRYQLMPGIIRELASSGTPFSILTKGTLLRRDLPLLTEAARYVPIDISLSIAIFDDQLQKSIEPGTPSTAARLATVRAAVDAGFSVTVFLMPIMPWLTDSTAQLEQAVSSIAAAGASRVIFGALHLRPGAREWFMDWIAREHPHLLAGYRRFYGSSSYAPASYRKALGAKVHRLLRAYGLEAEDDVDTPEQRALPVMSAPPPGQQTLF